MTGLTPEQAERIAAMRERLALQTTLIRQERELGYTKHPAVLEEKMVRQVNALRRDLQVAGINTLGLTPTQFLALGEETE